MVNASSEKGRLAVNGMSYSGRDGRNANSAVIVSVSPEDFGSEHPLAGVEFQEMYERKAFEQGGKTYKAPKSTWDEFANNKQNGKMVRNSLPEFAVEAIIEAMPYLGRKLKGFDSPDAVMTAVEARSSSPVRIIRDEEFQSRIKGLYPAGEGAGYAGGITSAAVDGIKIAEIIASKYRPF